MAKRRRITRSRLYAMSVSMYVKAQSGAAVTKKLDRVYAKASSKLEPDLEAATLEFNRRERWD